VRHRLTDDRHAAFLTKGKKRKTRTIPKRDWESLRAEVQGWMGEGQWELATPRHFVALFSLLHELVYKVPDGSMNGPGRLKATFMAGRMLEKEFSGEPVRMAEFVWWIWKREEGHEKFRRERGHGFTRITAYKQFSGALLTDYRIALTRQKGKS
jgi:hypothetical protein